MIIEAEPDLALALARTAELVPASEPRPLFETTFQHDGVLGRSDILCRLRMLATSTTASAGPKRMETRPSETRGIAKPTLTVGNRESRGNPRPGTPTPGTTC